jgi:DUF1365 family protein
MTASCLYRGEVMHHRLRPKRQRFSYPVTSWLIDLDELPKLERRLRLFSHHRFNLLSLFDRDLGDGHGAPKRWMTDLLAHHGIDLAGGRIMVHAFPRVLGIGFSPLTTWFCYGADGRLAAVHYEVHNTFGERHGYLAAVGAGDAGRTICHRADKLFHVSPFLDLAGLYRFALRPPGERYSLVIREMTPDRPDQPILIAGHAARRTALDDAALLRLVPQLLALPFIVIGGIHWQALKLWLRRIGFRAKPPAPDPISLASLSGDPSR